MLAWAVVLLWPGRAPLPVLVLLVVTISIGGPGSMVGFDLARTFNPPTRIGSATGIVNVGGFLAALSTIALIGLVLDHVAPAAPRPTPPARSAWRCRCSTSSGWSAWSRSSAFRRRTRRAIAEGKDGLYAAMRPSPVRSGSAVPGREAPEPRGDARSGAAPAHRDHFVTSPM